MYDVCPGDCPCWGSFTMCAPDCDAEMSRKEEELHYMLDAQLEDAMLAKKGG